MSYNIYHKSYSSAVEEAARFAVKKGFIIDRDEMFVDIGMNTSKPKNGDTTRFSITLYKDGKALQTKLQCQVFGRGDDSFINPYELNMYIL